MMMNMTKGSWTYCIECSEVEILCIDLVALPEIREEE